MNTPHADPARVKLYKLHGEDGSGHDRWRWRIALGRVGRKGDSQDIVRKSRRELIMVKIVARDMYMRPSVKLQA